MKSLKIFFPAQEIKCDCVGQMESESAPSTVKLLMASPRLRDMSKYISWLWGYEVIQQRYLGWEGENAMSLKDDCFSVCGSLKCLIYVSLVLSPYKLRSKKF